MSAVSAPQTLARPADDITVLDDPVDVLPDEPRRRRPRQLWIAAVVVVLAFLGAQGYQLYEIRRTGQEQRATDQALSVRRRSVVDAQERLGQRRGDVAVARTDLERLQSELAATIAQLETRTSERDELLTRLDALAGELERTRVSLTSTEVQLFGQVQQVGNLRVCLDGVTRALTLVTFDDRDGALRNLDSVADQCTAAGAAIDLAGAG